MSRLPAAFAAKIIDNMKGCGIVALTEDGTVTEWLADAEALTGYSRDEAVGMSIGRIFTEADVAAGAPTEEIRGVCAVLSFRLLEKGPAVVMTPGG